MYEYETHVDVGSVDIVCTFGAQLPEVHFIWGNLCLTLSEHTQPNPSSAQRPQHAQINCACIANSTTVSIKRSSVLGNL
jgi:hypothetical protein